MQFITVTVMNRPSEKETPVHNSHQEETSSLTVTVMNWCFLQSTVSDMLVD